MGIAIRDLVEELVIVPVKPLTGLTGALTGAGLAYGADKAVDLLTYGNTALPPNLDDPLYAIPYSVCTVVGITLGYVGAGFIDFFKRDSNGLMATPRIRSMAVAPYGSCTGRTNTGHNAVIFVSDYWNPEVDRSQKEALAEHKRDAGRLQKYLIDHGEFLGHAVDQTHLVGSAKTTDVRDAFRDQSVSSVVLIGHSRLGGWSASDGDVTWRNIAGFVEEAGHCKNGFGFKAGCDVIYDREIDSHQVLAPGYSHPGHGGSLYVLRGAPAKGKDFLPGSRMGHGIELYPRLFRLVPEEA